MFTGTGLRKLGWIEPAADGTLMRLVVRVMYPSFIIKELINNEYVSDLSNLTIAPVMGFATILLGFAVGYACGGLLGLKVGKGRRTFSMSIGIYNYGFIPIPILWSVFDRESVGLLFVHNVGIEIAIWTIGITIVSGAAMRDIFRKMVNPMVIAVISGVLLNLLGAGDWMPEWIITYLNFVGNCAIPTSLILSGATLADHLKLVDWRGTWPVSTGAILIRMVLLPAIMLGIAYVIPASRELKEILLVQSAMPAGIFPMVIARHYNGEPTVAVQVILATSLAGAIMIPFWLLLGQQLLF